MLRVVVALETVVGRVRGEEVERRGEGEGDVATVPVAKVTRGMSGCRRCCSCYRWCCCRRCYEAAGGFVDIP